MRVIFKVLEVDEDHGFFRLLEVYDEWTDFDTEEEAILFIKDRNSRFMRNYTIIKIYR